MTVLSAALGGLLMLGLATSLVAAERPVAPATVHGLIIRLHEAPTQQLAPQRAAALAADIARRQRLSQRWQAVVQATGLQGLGDWRLEPVGAASQLLVPPTPLTQAQAAHWKAQLAARPEVAWVEEEVREPLQQAVVPNDPWFAGAQGQWWLQTVSGSNSVPLADRRRGVPGVQMAWGLSTGRSQDVVAVLDTGITAHPDLAAQRLLPGYDFVSDWDTRLGRGFANDGDGRDADPSDPGDWVGTDDKAQDPARYSSCALTASTWHGTGVVGVVAAATQNGQGVAALTWQGRVLPVRVAGKCGASVRDIIDGMRWAAGLPVCQRWQQAQDPGSGCGAWVPANPSPARVVNISFGGPSACHAEYQAAVNELWQRGVVVVAAAGNQHGDPARPANCDKVMGVTALNRDGFKASYANFGASVRLATVGGDDSAGTWGRLLADGGLLTLHNEGAQAPAAGSYGRLVGTSFAAPMVSGTLALMLAVHPELTAQELVEGVQLSARPHVNSRLMKACSAANPGRCLCSSQTCGAGMLDTEQALRYARAKANSLAYQVPQWSWVELDTPELQQAVALGPDREPSAGAGPPPGGATPVSGGGGALAWPALAAGLLALLFASAPTQRCVRRRRRA
ncbi:MAG: S8 family peptidase [Ideonella sp.]|nr:S8 family peptidase [Ideonella sp.]